MTEKTAYPASIIATVKRLATDMGLIPFVTPPECYGWVFELEDGAKVFVERGQPAPPAFKAVTSVWSAFEAIGFCAETSPEVLEIAGRGMSDPKSLTEAEIRSVCASAVAQAPKPAEN